MLKNNVFNVSVNTKKWVKAALVRACKTMAQTALSMMTVGQAIFEVNWVNILAVSATAGVISILTSVVGVPEVTAKKEE